MPRVGVTKRQRAYIRNRLKGMDKQESALKAGYSPSVAHNPKAMIEDRIVDKSLVKLLDNVGFTDDWIAKEIMEGATDPNEGRPARIAYLKLGVQLKGHLIEKTETTHKAEVIVYELPAEKPLEIEGEVIEIPKEIEIEKED